MRSGIPVEIKLVEPLGSDTLIHFDVAGASAIARVDPALKPKVGERLFLQAAAGQDPFVRRRDGRFAMSRPEPPST